MDLHEDLYWHSCETVSAHFPCSLDYSFFHPECFNNTFFVRRIFFSSLNLAAHLMTIWNFTASGSKNLICFHISKRFEILTHTIFLAPESVFRAQVALENEYWVVLDILPWDCSALFTWCVCTVPAR